MGIFVTKIGQAVRQNDRKRGFCFVDSIKFAGSGLQTKFSHGKIYHSKVPKLYAKGRDTYGKNKAAA